MRALLSPAHAALLAATTLGAGLILPVTAPAQMLVPAEGRAAENDTAMLIADRVEIAGDNRLIASGAVEVLVDGIRLKAQTITYDASADQLTIDGPIYMVTDDGTILVASQAELSDDLQNGILRSARMVLAQQLQLAATEINRVGGRYTQLYKAVASSCTVCASNPVPLWQIRAERIIHDEDAQQLYFHNARFEIAGVPVFYLPRLRLPDPSLERATGLLTPEFRSTDQLGFGIKLPYFITLGDHRDLTVTPYLSSNFTRTVELRYRQAFRNGDIELNGAITQDDILDDETRAYLFAEGAFDLPRDFELTFDIETVTDNGYLLDYDYSSKDRLDSAIELQRVKRDELITAEFVNYYSLRSTENNRTQPTLVFDSTWERRFHDTPLGGIVTASLEGHGHYRSSEVDDEGRDIGRIAATFDWQRDWVTPNGLLIEAETALVLDHTGISQDDDFDSTVTRAIPAAAVELRWPLLKSTSGGASHLLEPVVQLVYSPDTDDVPNDESTEPELDEGNLFSLSRFPGGDQYESGLRANVGLGWTRHDPAGWSMGVTVGRILRAEDLGEFDGYEPLEGQSSDWLAAVELDLPGNVGLTNRALFDDGFGFSKNELRLDYANDALQLGTSYIWMADSEAEGIDEDVSELTVDSTWALSRSWQSEVDIRYDFETDRAAKAALGLTYAGDCVSVDLSLSRRFTSSTSVEPTTSFDLSVQLAGFGSGNSGNAARRRNCAG